MRSLYPSIHPYWSDHIAVDGLHRLYVEQCGNPEGIPVIFLHGGPGAGCEAWHRSFFDPDKYRIILFDQRGAGRSTPHASLLDNTTQHLVQDMQRIRKELDIDKWLVFGGSWGSTLGLAYAQTHPECVSGLILRGIFMCRKQEIEWFYQRGADRIFPDYWQDYVSPIPLAERHDLLSAYYKRLTGEDELARMAAAKAWSVWEGRTATLLPSTKTVDFFSDTHVALSLARIECHYFMHDAFLQAEQLLHETHKLKGIPGIIVQGRYDMICPLESAWQLAQAWPDAELQIIDDGGHSAAEPGIADALIEATDRFSELLA